MREEGWDEGERDSIVERAAEAEFEARRDLREREFLSECLSFKGEFCVSEKVRAEASRSENGSAAGQPASAVSQPAECSGTHAGSYRPAQPVTLKLETRYTKPLD